MPPTTTPNQFDGPKITVKAAESLLYGRRCKIDANGELAYAGAAENADGIVHGGDYALGDYAVMRRFGFGTSHYVASNAIARGALFYAAASGKVTGTPNNFIEGRAMDAATVDGNLIQGIDKQMNLL